MNLRHYNANEANDIVHLFASVFAASDGESEGALIGKLATELFETTSDRKLLNYVAVDAGQVVASIFFTRLEFRDHHDAFILAPVAVRRSSVKTFEG